MKLTFLLGWTKLRRQQTHKQGDEANAPSQTSGAKPCSFQLTPKHKYSSSKFNPGTAIVNRVPPNLNQSSSRIHHDNTNHSYKNLRTRSPNTCVAELVLQMLALECQHIVLVHFFTDVNNQLGQIFLPWTAHHQSTLPGQEYKGVTPSGLKSRE